MIAPVQGYSVILQETQRWDFKLLKLIKEEEEGPTFLLTTVDNLKIFGNSGTGVHLHMGVREAEGTFVAHLSIVRKNIFHCAAPYRAVISLG